MEQLIFDRKKYGMERLIDSAEMKTYVQEERTLLTNFYVLICAPKGAGSINVGSRVDAVRERSCLFVAPGKICRVRDFELQEARWLFFEGAFLDQIFQIGFAAARFDFFYGEAAPALLQLGEQFAEIYSVFGEIHRELQRRTSISQHFAGAALGYLLARIERSYFERQGIIARKIEHPAYIRLNQLLAESPNRYRTVRELAAQLDCSPRKLNALCRQYFAATAKETLKQRQILEIKQYLLQTELSVQEIGYQLGFSDPGNFVRFFRASVGLPPETFRLENSARPN